MLRGKKLEGRKKGGFLRKFRAPENRVSERESSDSLQKLPLKISLEREKFASFLLSGFSNSSSETPNTLLSTHMDGTSTHYTPITGPISVFPFLCSRLLTLSLSISRKEDCYKCVVFHEKARNVLQYKESKQKRPVCV